MKQKKRSRIWFLFIPTLFCHSQNAGLEYTLGLLDVAIQFDFITKRNKKAFINVWANASSGVLRMRYIWKKLLNSEAISQNTIEALFSDKEKEMGFWLREYYHQQ